MSGRRVPCVCDNTPKGVVGVPVDEQSAAALEAARNLKIATLTYLTPAEAATYLRKKTVNAFRKFARRHVIPTCRDGRAVLYRRKDLDLAIQPEHLRLAKGRAS